MNPRKYSFEDVSVSPFAELLDSPRGESDHKGGPLWPAWESQIAPRHCRNGVPVDIAPQDLECIKTKEEPCVWAGPIVGHFGHMVAEFSSRILPSLRYFPGCPLVFAKHIRSGMTNFENGPKFLPQILRWFDIPNEQAILVREPTRFSTLSVVEQSEQLLQVPPFDSYLDLLDEHGARKIGSIKSDHRTLYVSRAGQRACFAGEEYLEKALLKLGVVVIRPENLSLEQQLISYSRFHNIIFAEGSAMHGAQLLGRSLHNVLVLNRRKGASIAQAALKARSKKLQYTDVATKILFGCKESGGNAPEAGMPIFDVDLLLQCFHSQDLPIEQFWDQEVYLDAVCNDLVKWCEQKKKEKVSETPAFWTTVRTSASQINETVSNIVERYLASQA